MDKREAINYLKERLGEIPYLAKLKYNNYEYPLWIRTIRGVVENVFGRDSYEYQMIAEQYQINGKFSEVRQNQYIQNLKRRETSILSIIQTWETLGLETETKRNSAPTETPISSFVDNKKNSISESKANWKAIQEEFGITKTRFGKNINFIKDLFKRKIIFRDVEQAFSLASLGFSKPAVILAGSVIEELLRLYLEHKSITPINNSFDGYIQTYEQKGLLKAGIFRLSDSVRHFRNLVHLSKEETKSHTISKSTAKGAVASIFTIANDF